MNRVLALTFFGLVAACAADEPQPETPASDETSGQETSAETVAEPAAPDAAAEVAWADMDKQARGKFMMEKVMPVMKPLFQEFDGERFAEFGCKTCHGENAKEVGMAMPNTLAPLDPSKIGAIFQSDQPMAKFMVGKVWPTMAELLGAEPFNPETGQGFACLNCHATKTE